MFSSSNIFVINEWIHKYWHEYSVHFRSENYYHVLIIIIIIISFAQENFLILLCLLQRILFSVSSAYFVKVLFLNSHYNIINSYIHLSSAPLPNHLLYVRCFSYCVVIYFVRYFSRPHLSMNQIRHIHRLYTQLQYHENVFGHHIHESVHVLAQHLHVILNVMLTCVCFLCCVMCVCIM